MDLLKKIFHFDSLKNYISFSLMFFFMNYLLVAKADENKYLIINTQEEIKLKEFYSQNQTEFSQHDRLNNQLKMFFGFDPEDPEKSFYPDLLIIEDSDYIRNMYKKKINDMTTNRINYNISR